MLTIFCYFCIPLRRRRWEVEIKGTELMGEVFRDMVLGLADYPGAKKNFKKSFGKQKILLPLQPATEVTTEGKEKD